VTPAFETVNFAVVLSKLQGLNLIAGLFARSFVPTIYVLLVIVRVQEPDWTVLVPVAVPLIPTEVSEKLVALSVNSRAVRTLRRAGSNTSPLPKVKR
jgi:hypothetical protein